MGTTRGVSNINTCKLNHISKVIIVILLFMRRSALRFDVYAYLPIEFYVYLFWCFLRNFDGDHYTFA